MLHVWTRKKVDVQPQVVMAQVMWPDCTPIIGASLAVRTKTGCHQKVSLTPVHPLCLPYVDHVVQWCARFVWSMLCQLYEFHHDCLDEIRQVGFISFEIFCLGPWFCLLVGVVLICMVTTQTAEIETSKPHWLHPISTFYQVFQSFKSTALLILGLLIHAFSVTTPNKSLSLHSS